jgi:hypothetical protein
MLFRLQNVLVPAPAESIVQIVIGDPQHGRNASLGAPPELLLSTAASEKLPVRLDEQNPHRAESYIVEVILGPRCIDCLAMSDTQVLSGDPDSGEPEH